MPILRRNCPHCPAEHVAFSLAWAAGVPGLSYFWNCAAICGACGKPICFQARRVNGNPPTHHDGDIEPQWTVSPTWPQREVSAAPLHTPTAVARRFLEGEDAYRRESWNAAVAMYRSALDIGTKGLVDVPAGRSFFKRLEWLHERHRITPEMRSWADHVRIEGNEALHDPEDFSEVDVKPLRMFTEMFLKYMFELPGEVASFSQNSIASEVGGES